MNCSRSPHNSLSPRGILLSSPGAPGNRSATDHRTARADTSVSRPAMWLLVVDLSDSFSDYWGPLADALGVELRRTTPAEASAASTGATAVVLAAGGVERDLPQSIPALALPNGTPVFAIGAVTSHRTAARAVAAGAADYFALPGDRDALHAALEAAVARRRSALDRAALAHLEAQSHAFREIIGESPALKQALNRAA